MATKNNKQEESFFIKSENYKKLRDKLPYEDRMALIEVIQEALIFQINACADYMRYGKWTL